MKDTLNKIFIGIVVAVFGAGIGWYLSSRSKPALEVVFDNHMLLESERVALFRLRNVGGALATGCEVRFASGIDQSMVSIISGPHDAKVSGMPTVLTAPQVKPRDEVLFCIRQARDTTITPRDLLATALYNEGAVSIGSLEARTAALVRNARLTGFSQGLAFASTVAYAIVAWLTRKTRRG